jgi:hypothetical protein
MRAARFAFILTVLTTISVAAADWPQWRGPNGTGATSETNLPVRWNASENVMWKAPIAGLGVSTPIVSGDRVFVTSQLGSGVRRDGNHPRLVQGGNAAAAGERELGASRRIYCYGTFLRRALRAQDRYAGPTSTEFTQRAA